MIKSLFVFISGILLILFSMIYSISVQSQEVNSKKNPGDILKLENWKLTLPTGSDEKPAEIKQPTLKNFKRHPWFIVNSKNNAVIFRAPVNGITTKGSDYPRSELREMTKNGTSNASWSTDSGIHAMRIDQAITAVPLKKQHVVAGQIHDDSDDVIVIRLEYPNLYINVDGKNVFLLDRNYKLGKRFSIKFYVENDQTHVYYNNSQEPIYTLNKHYSDAYFKAGVYTQSNCNREGTNGCSENNFGEVLIYNLQIAHK